MIPTITPAAATDEEADHLRAVIRTTVEMSAEEYFDIADAILAAGFRLASSPDAPVQHFIIDADSNGYPCSAEAHAAQQSVIMFYEDKMDELRAEKNDAYAQGMEVAAWGTFDPELGVAGSMPETVVSDFESAARSTANLCANGTPAVRIAVFSKLCKAWLGGQQSAQAADTKGLRKALERIVSHDQNNLNTTVRMLQDIAYGAIRAAIPATVPHHNQIATDVGEGETR